MTPEVAKNQLHHEGHKGHEAILKNLWLILRALRPLRGEHWLRSNSWYNFKINRTLAVLIENAVDQSS